MVSRRVVVGLGANLGDRVAQIDAAIERLASLEGVELIQRSPLYETAPVGGPAQPHYLNAAVLVRTGLEAPALMRALLEVEAMLGRKRNGTRDAPRTLDLDLLWIEGETSEADDCAVPHPRLVDRAFAVVPLLDVAPDAVDPRTGRRFAELPVASETLKPLGW